MRILTGADGRYFRCLRQFLRSVVDRGLDRIHPVTIFDLGMSAEQCARLAHDHPDFTIERFRFEDHPDHLQLQYWTYAWKPVIISDMAARTGGPVIWFDSATVVLGPLSEVERSLAITGLYTPYGGGGIPPVHPGTVEYLRAEGIDPRWAACRSRATGVCAFDPRRPVVARLLERWKRLALVKDCIAPAGATLQNHKYETAILAMLLYQGQADGDFELTRDEIDISASHPIQFVLTRAWVADWLPLALHPILVEYFRMRRRLDAWQWRLRRLGRASLPPDQPIR